jgi:hypothetical protein
MFQQTQVLGQAETVVPGNQIDLAHAAASRVKSAAV